MNELQRQHYVEYHEYLIAAVVLASLGAALFVAGFSVGSGGLLVEEQGEWFRVHVVDHTFITGPFLSAFGMVLLVFAQLPWRAAKRVKTVAGSFEVSQS